MSVIRISNSYHTSLKFLFTYFMNWYFLRPLLPHEKHLKSLEEAFICIHFLVIKTFVDIFSSSLRCSPGAFSLFVALRIIKFSDLIAVQKCVVQIAHATHWSQDNNWCEFFHKLLWNLFTVHNCELEFFIFLYLTYTYETTSLSWTCHMIILTLFEYITRRDNTVCYDSY